MPTVIKKCTCSHGYQDKTYGPKLRVHNLCKPTGGKFLGATCTVCNHVELFKDGGKNVLPQTR